MEVAVMAVFGLTATHHQVIGVTGAAAVLVAVLAAIVGGPAVGFLSAIVGGLAFYGFVSDWGATAPTTATLLSTGAWAMAALAAGLIARRLRRLQAARRAAEQDAARLHERLESNLLPRLPDEIRGFRISTRYRPGEQRLGIGGDFYDAAALPGGDVAVVIGDIVGHGADAAALGATIRASWRALVLGGIDTRRLVSTLGVILEQKQSSAETFATICLAWLPESADHARFLTLGHPPPLLISAGQVVMPAISTLPPLGVMPVGDWTPARVDLPPSWTLLFFTDGLIEGRESPDATERYGLDRLLRVLTQELHRRPQEDAPDRIGTPDPRPEERALDRMLEDVAKANGDPLSDDLAILSISGKARGNDRCGRPPIGRQAPP
jgi:hypothetical protein